MTPKTKKSPAKPRVEAPKRRNGRPTGLTTEVEEVLLKNVRGGLPIKSAALAVGISERTFHNWMKRGLDESYRVSKGEAQNPTEEPFLNFSKSVEQAKEEAKALHVSVVSKAGLNGDWRASAWWLQRQFRDEFGDNPPLVAQTVNNSLNISTTMAELDALIEEVKVSRKKELEAP